MEQQVLTNLHNKLHAVIYAHLGVIILLIASLLGAGYVAVKVHEHDLAHAEQLQQAFNQQAQVAAQAQKQLADIIAADAAQRAQETAQEQQIELAMAKRAQEPLPAPITAALAPSANAAVVVSGLEVAYSDVQPPMAPSVTPDGKIAVSVSNAQAEVSAKVALGKYEADLHDEVALFTLEQTKSASFQKDLATCQATVSQDETALADAKKTIAAYEKVAKQSRFRKILGSIGRNAERVAILVVGIELGHKL